MKESSLLRRSNIWIFGTMLFFGCCGLLSAFMLSVERIELLLNPQAKLICDFNIFVSCSTVMQTWQAKIFGFPNSFIGLMAYPVVITVAVAGLAGIKFPRWFMLTAQACFGLGVIFAYWLFFQSVFVIQVLCPWCLLVTFSTTILFETLLRYNLRENNFNIAKNTHAKVLAFLKKDYDKMLVAAWIACMILVVLVKFQDALL